MRVSGHSVFSIKSLCGSSPAKGITTGRSTLSMEELDDIVDAYDPGLVWVSAYIAMKERRLKDVGNMPALWGNVK